MPAVAILPRQGEALDYRHQQSLGRKGRVDVFLERQQLLDSEWDLHRPQGLVDSIQKIWDLPP